MLCVSAVRGNIILAVMVFRGHAMSAEGLLWLVASGLGANGLWYLWFGAGVLGAVCFLVFAYWLIRRLLGHRKWRGTWYSASQFAELVQILWEDQCRGHRVMRHDEIKLLRKWQTGSVKGLGFDRIAGYY